MHVAVVGAGALGSVYGVRLARRAEVTFVVRRASPRTITLVRATSREQHTPALATSVPEHADVVLLAVGTEDLDALDLGGSEAPLVILTPMLPAGWARIQARFGDRAHAALPSVISFQRDDGTILYWLPPSPTKLDEPRGHRVVLEELAAALGDVGLRTRFELGVHESNPATTVCFIPIAMALAIAGSVDALRADEALLSLVSHACSEGHRLSLHIGRPELFARLAPMYASPWALRGWLGLLRGDARRYAETHFGHKLAAQHRSMIAEMIALARAKQLPHASLDAIRAALAER